MSLTLDKQNDYRDRYAAMRPGWHPATTVYEQIIRETVQNMALDETAVLDTGCGRGGVIEQLTDLKLSVIGIDPDWLSLFEHRVTQLPRAVATADEIPLPAASVNLVISAWVLEHLPTPEKTFSEVARVLKPGGAFVFIAPNKHSPIALLNRTLKPLQNTLVPLLYGRAEDDTFPVQYRANTRKQLQTLAAQSGLTLEQLHLIEDPTYLAFNSILFRLNVLMSQVLPASMRVHLAGLCRKPHSSN